MYLRADVDKGNDGRCYIRGKDFHRPDQEQDDYWTWQETEARGTALLNFVHSRECCANRRAGQYLLAG
jgi:hypothetical protein